MRIGRGPVMLAVGLLAVTVSGCSGCRSDSESPQASQEEEEREDFESGELHVLPTDGKIAAYGLKPGHWAAVRQTLKSNRADFDGILEGRTTDRSSVPMTIEGTRIQLRSRRPVSLPKGQAKSVELTYFIPRGAARGERIGLVSELQTRYGNAPRQSQSQIANRMRPHQMYLVVLASNPDEYAYVKTLESIRPPTDEMVTTGHPGDYIVVQPMPGSVVPIPPWSLMWTATSHLLWDDFDPTSLNSDQQRALIDWLHWGGQIIISGPKSVERLRTSFLADYLPADIGPTQTIDEGRLAVLNASWSVPSQRKDVDTTLSLPKGTVLEVLQLSLRPEGRFVDGTAELVAERLVGRGRVAVTAFSLTSRPMLNWRSFDNFFNACLLRRPSRRFVIDESGGRSTVWNDVPQRSFDVDQEQSTESYDLDLLSDVGSYDEWIQRSPREAMLTSRLRYFSRDAAVAQAGVELPEESRDFDLAGYRTDAHSGIAGWNDSSATSQLAQRSLTTAAGITVPDRTLILSALALYLFILVPANWAIFRAIDRVEWAWLSVPLIAIIGTVAVVRLAQLDIGFARSRTELAIIETQPAYPRAHITRYLGLYTSLTTNYRLQQSDDSAMVAPFASPTRSRSLLGTQETVLLERTSQRDARVQLQGLVVNSNSTEMVHSESMLELDGTLQYHERPSGLTEVSNETSHDLLAVAVVRRHRGRLEFAGLPLFKAGTKIRVQFREVEPHELINQWQQISSSQLPSAEWGEIQKLQALAAEPERIREGDVKLFAFSHTLLPGLTIEPTASQQSCLNLWVAHLRYGPLPAPRSDSNSSLDILSEDPDDRID